MRLAAASLSSRDETEGKNSMTRGSALMRAKGSRSSSRHQRSTRRSVRISWGNVMHASGRGGAVSSSSVATAKELGIVVVDDVAPHAKEEVRIRRPDGEPV